MRASDLGLPRRMSLVGPNCQHPDRLSGHERLDEIAEILALGLIRLLAPKSSEEVAGPPENSLDFAGERSVDQPVSRKDRWP